MKNIKFQFSNNNLFFEDVLVNFSCALLGLRRQYK